MRDLDLTADVTEGQFLAAAVGLILLFFVMLAFLEFRDIKEMIRRRTMAEVFITDPESQDSRFRKRGESQHPTT
jgi:hypothetical protein